MIARWTLAAAVLLAGPRPQDPLSSEDWKAIDRGLDLIRRCQMDDGMIRIKGAGDPVWTVPYVSNFAAMALLAAHELRPNPGDVSRAERWLLWYADNQEPDGTICDREGTVASYKSNGRRDSTDSYAATFLMAVSRHRRAAREGSPPGILRAAVKALAAIEAVTQDDGLTFAKPDYPMKYLMDNIEVYGGLIEGASFFDAAGLEKEASKARRMAARLAASLAKFWSEKDRRFEVAIDGKGVSSGGFEKPYPHGLAQLFALAHLPPARPGLWKMVRGKFKPGDEGMPVERWLMAAAGGADPQEREELRRATREALLGFTAEGVYVDRPALAILALIDGPARFTGVRPAAGD